ncbi:hypothetical protein CHEID_00345 [Corynebacterium heidelbergense]|nr:hypothetical protein CHEID_00345 [Corynebacterium heidelbergense]
MTDAKIIDAYEYAYNVAQAVGADHRSPEMPPQRDRQTMARRVRGYVLSGSENSRGSVFTGATAGVSARAANGFAYFRSRRCREDDPRTSQSSK